MADIYALIPSWVFYVACIVACVVVAVVYALKGVKKADASGLITTLVTLLTAMGSKASRKVQVAQESLDIVYRELTSGEITDEGIAVIQDTINRIIDAFGDEPQVQTVLTDMLTSVFSMTPKSTLKRVYSDNAMSVLVVIETFTEAVSSETVAQDK